MGLWSPQRGRCHQATPRAPCPPSRGSHRRAGRTGSVFRMVILACRRCSPSSRPGSGILRDSAPKPFGYSNHGSPCDSRGSPTPSAASRIAGVGACGATVGSGAPWGPGRGGTRPVLEPRVSPADSRVVTPVARRRGSAGCPGSFGGHEGAGTLVDPGPVVQRVGRWHLSSRGWRRPGLLDERACGTRFLSGVTGIRSGETWDAECARASVVGGGAPDRGGTRRRSAGSGAVCTRRGVRPGHPGSTGGRVREARSRGRRAGGAQACDQPYSRRVYVWLLRVSADGRFRSGMTGVGTGIRGTRRDREPRFPGRTTTYPGDA